MVLNFYLTHFVISMISLTKSSQLSLLVVKVKPKSLGEGSASIFSLTPPHFMNSELIKGASKFVKCGTANVIYQLDINGSICH